MKQFIKNSLKKVFPRLGGIYSRFKAFRQSNREPSMTPMGFQLGGNSLMESGTFEPGETKVFTELLPSIDVLINAGANIGYYCCIALAQHKKVVAFEPVPQNVKSLLRNVHSNGWSDDIEVFPLALGDKCGVIEMFGGGSGASFTKGWAGQSSDAAQLVPCSTLDTVLGSRFKEQKCLIMADVEGAELMMLQGADDFLSRDIKPIWFIEITVSTAQPEGIRINPNLLETFQKLWDHGYKAWTTHHEIRPVGYDEVAGIVNGAEDTLWGDTFLFLDPSAHHDLISLVETLPAFGKS